MENKIYAINGKIYKAVKCNDLLNKCKNCYFFDKKNCDCKNNIVGLPSCEEFFDDYHWRIVSK